MAISEGFIDSAQLKNTIFSHAKELNYLPNSAQSSKATVRVDFTASGTNQPYIIQKGQSFSSVVKNNSLVFSIPETITVASANTTFSFTTDIYEGVYVKDSYIFNNTNQEFPTFKITNPLVDLSSLVVYVYQNGNVIGDIYLYTSSLLGLTSSSNVFFVQTNVSDGSYEVLFGDGVVGNQPLNNSVVVLDYRVCSGSAGNDASTFSINFDPTGSGQLTSSAAVTTINNSVGGVEQQSIESVRFYAPKAFEVQERAVIASDYEILLKNKFPEIQSINVYGGEELTPPLFGRVVIALAITNVDGLPSSKIDQYTNFIRSRSMMTISPIWVNPKYTYIQVNSTVRYNINVTNDTPNRILTIVDAVIANYNTINLNNFNTTLRFSQLSTAIDQADPSIISNSTNIKLYQKLQPAVSVSTPMLSNYSIVFNIPLVNDLPVLPSTHPTTSEKVLSSSQFMYKGNICYLEDDNQGIVRITQVNDTNCSLVQIVGTIDYDTGTIILNNFVPDSYVGNYLLIYVTPRDNDVSCNQNTILTIADTNITITPISQ